MTKFFYLSRNVCGVLVDYKDIFLDITTETEVLHYLGFWTTPYGNMQAAMKLFMDRTLRAKDAIQGHPLAPRQAVEIFASKTVGNFRYLATVPWKRRDLNRLDRYWRQGYKTVWKLNTTLAIIARTLNAHGDRCMKTKDVALCIMEDDLQRAMKKWLCTSKEELTSETATHTWDDTVDNVWHRLAASDHLLDLKSWKTGPPWSDISKRPMGSSVVRRNNSQEIW